MLDKDEYDRIENTYKHLNHWYSPLAEGLDSSGNPLPINEADALAQDMGAKEKVESSMSADASA